MNAQGHLNNLVQKHKYLDQKLETESRRPMPDQSMVSQLKKEKLRLKEAISHIQVSDI